MLYTLPHNGRLRRFAMALPVDWFDWSGSDGGGDPELDLVVWLHGETDSAEAFLNEAVRAESLLRAGPLRLPAAIPWSVTDADAGVANLLTKSKAVHIAPQAIGFGAPLADYAPWVASVSGHAGEDTGVWANVAGMGSAILPDDDVAFLSMLRQRVEQRLLDAVFEKRGRRLDQVFRRSLLAGHAGGGVQVYKMMAERPGLFDAYAVVGASAGGELKNGDSLADVAQRYVREPDGTVPPLLVIHHEEDRTFSFAGDSLHRLHQKWADDCSNETSGDLGFWPDAVVTSVSTWSATPPASIPAGFSEPDAVAPVTCFLETTTGPIDTTDMWPSVQLRGAITPTPTAWSFDAAGLIWTWFRDHT